ncbi:hypothetical protein M011DRAFT_404725 [Sporormia fimetaria CBS 119925]|uniref:t-SNARE coiled-coil homology domain-containing protein n=1 Tax=Sporormia fimetaria CBS 119925 TaxID=1340428 RepID=A0A6A6V764_9PLEO|nr:hypothetical protein M011DRAFT_404725 [Sporormia fimetaria CBS 119925]
MDLTSDFNLLLRSHGCSSIERGEFHVDELEEFLKEAYRIRGHIVELHTYLRSIRQSYLSIARPPRRKQNARLNGSSLGPDADAKHLTDKQRDEIDANAKQLLRELNHAVKGLSDTEQIRQEAERTIAYKKRARQGLGVIGRWAAGGALTAKSPEEELEEARANTIKVHRESIIWYLQRQLEECGRFQTSMMEIRLAREVEKSKSILYKARGTMPAMGGSSDANFDAAKEYRSTVARQQDEEAKAVEQQLDPEQLQLFAQENQDMLKHYEDTLDQVRMAEKSLLEISELQTTLATNLSVQAAHIDQLVEDSHLTAENVGSGNRELQRATERRSTAQMVFYGTSAFCLTLILWDLFI